MTMHDVAQAQEHSTPNPSALMALWLSSGGALDAVAAVDSHTAGMARSRRHDDQVGDDAQGGSYPTAPALCQSGTDDRLQAGSFTTNPFNCADDGLLAGAPSSRPAMCSDDGLLAADFSGRMPHNCADDGLQSSNVTKDYACIPPSVDDGLTVGSFTTNPFNCVDDGLRAGYATSTSQGGYNDVPRSLRGIDDGLVGGNVTTSALTCADEGLRSRSPTQVSGGWGC